MQPRPDPSRVTPSLAKALRLIAFVPTLRGGEKVGDLVTLLSKQATLPLFADRRVENDVLYLNGPSNLHMTLLDVAEGLAQAMDMYWRQVGDVYLLAVSPADPRDLAQRRYKLKMQAELKPFLSVIAKAGLLPEGLSLMDLAGDGRPLADFDPSFLSSVQNQILFASPLDRQRFADVTQSSDYLKGTVQFAATGGPSVMSQKGRFEVGGYSFHFGHF